MRGASPRTGTSDPLCCSAAMPCLTLLRPRFVPPILAYVLGRSCQPTVSAVPRCLTHYLLRPSPPSAPVPVVAKLCRAPSLPEVSRAVRTKLSAS